MDRSHAELAVDNISGFGDTDIFPFPFENHVLRDQRERAIDLLLEIHGDFDSRLQAEPPVNVSTCAPVGYTGFRWATQIDPLWNAYFLALVISVASDIELARLPVTSDCVFSYRYNPDKSTGGLFDQSTNWRSFQEKSLEYASDPSTKYVVTCDIADYYTRIYHHRLDVALKRAITKDTGAVHRIGRLLQNFSGTVSYGLPVGGPAARILAELELNSTDRILQLGHVRFTRFVDDFHLFAESREDAYRKLTFLAVKLLKNEGLSLAKHKSQILTASEFKTIVEARLHGDPEDANHVERSRFMSLSLHYDPYSPNADEDYERLRGDLSTFDVVALLNEEIRKSRVNQHFSRQLLKSFTVLSPRTVGRAILSIIDSLDSFAPVFTSVMIAVQRRYSDLDHSLCGQIQNKLRDLVASDSYLIQVELNTLYLARVLALEHSVENEQTLVDLSARFNESELIKAFVIQAFAHWRSHAWLSDRKSGFATMNRWERRTFILASYVLGDEGRHWRDHHKSDFSSFETLVRDWAASRTQSPTWEIPL